jgi:ribosomal protein L11 methyltransferase
VLTARVPDAIDDEVAAVLGEGSLGVEVASCGPGMSEVRVVLPAGGDVSSWRDRAARILAAHGLAEGDARVAVAAVADERWVERWQESLAPLPLGERFTILPSDSAVAAPGRTPIRLVPGMAFGTGEHPTTRLAASGLERAVRTGSRWLDMGTGTGILAVVAALCGATDVVAVDIDPQAAEVASAVADANGVASAVSVRAGSIEAAGAGPFDGIAANIQASFFMEHAGDLASRLAAGGVLLATGVLRGDVPEVAERLTGCGLTVESTAGEGAWACLTARRMGR